MYLTLIYTNLKLNTDAFPIPWQNDLDTVRLIIQSFIHRVVDGDICFDPPATDDLHKAVVKELEALNIPIASVQCWILWGCQLVENFYPNHPVDLKVLIVICSLAIFYIDDVLAGKPELLLSFQPNILAGISQPDLILESLSSTLIPRMWTYFDSLAANAIAVGFYEFINGTAMEVITKTMVHSPSAPRFPEYVRLKAGAPTPYAYWLFYSPSHSSIQSYVQSIPDLLALINRVNDILSFYKEELAGEDDNFVHMTAKISNKSVTLTLQDICDESLQLIDDVSKTLAMYPGHLALFRGFLSGYLRFHTSTTRYRLRDLMTI